MSKAYLTIDDGPTKNTKAITDFLLSKNITPIMFFSGEQTVKAKEEGIYAIQKGVIVGSHSYSHPHFSELSLDECITEIEGQEKLVDMLYKEAGVPRKYKLFRFPYGDRGGKNKDALQEYFKSNGFCRFDDSKIAYDWYKDNKINEDYDVTWTFDFSEYNYKYNNGFTFDEIIKIIHDNNPKEGGPLLGPNAYNIVLIHDHEKSEEYHPNYFKEIINYVLEQGVEFIKPEFIHL